MPKKHKRIPVDPARMCRNCEFFRPTEAGSGYCVHQISVYLESDEKADRYSDFPFLLRTHHGGYVLENDSCPHFSIFGSGESQFTEEKCTVDDSCSLDEYRIY